MHREEAETLEACADCGAEISATLHRAYLFGSDGALCWECSLKRGGDYDTEMDSWCTSPRIDDLFSR